MIFPKRYIFIIIAIVPLLIGACNPFAPAISTDDLNFPVEGDQKTVNGLFQNWRYSYIFKDTVAYGQLLDEDFIFLYRNYDEGIEYSWRKQVDMIATNNLFISTQTIDLVWNETIFDIGDSLYRNVAKSFNLQITFDQSDITRINGRANIELRRQSVDSIWRILTWIDESNY